MWEYIFMFMLIIIIGIFLIVYRPKVFHVIGGGNQERVFVTGKGGAGKSTYTSKQKRYFPIHLDEIVRVWHKNEGIAFSDVYRKEGKGRYRKRLVDAVNKLGEGKPRIIVEGSLRDIDTIKALRFTKYVYIEPKNSSTLEKRFWERFKKEPELYGRLGKLRNGDKGGVAMAAYRNNNYSPIKKLIKKIAIENYHSSHEKFKELKRIFPTIKKVLT